MKFKEYLLVFLYLEHDKEEKIRIPSVKFWGITLLIVACGLKIQMNNGHYLTEYDCFLEMNDKLRNYKYPDGFPRAWWEQFQYLRGLIEKPYWVE